MQAQGAANTSLSRCNESQANKQSQPLHPHAASKESPTMSKKTPAIARTTNVDDVDIMLKHEDFQKLLSLAVDIQQAHSRVQKSTGQPYRSQQQLPKNQLSPEETIKSTLSLQALSGPAAAGLTVHRGDYPITDAIMDDSIRVLQRELQDIHKSMQQQLPKKPAKTKARSKKEAIAIKYSKWQTDILMKWMIEHKDAPFPDQAAIDKLMQQTGLSHSQVVNWTTNVRKRNRKATCQGGKKPHHFIDFLFLVHDRETRQQDTCAETQQLKKPRREHLFSPSFQMAIPESGPCPSNANALQSPRSENSLFEDTEPLDIDAIDPEDEVLKEFSIAWLSGHSDVDNFQLDDLATAIPDDQTLLPSVTNDSQDQDMPMHRTSSFDVLDDMSEGDMESWANQFGLSFDEETDAVL